MNAFHLAEMRAVLRNREPGYAVIATDPKAHWWSCVVHDRGRFVLALSFLDGGIINMAFIWKSGNDGYNVRLRHVSPADALRLALDLRDGKRAMTGIDGTNGVMARNRILRPSPMVSPELLKG